MSDAVHLQDKEEILYTARKHWFIFTSETFFIFILAFVPAVFFIVPEGLRASLFNAVRFVGDGGALFMSLWSAWFLVLWGIFTMLWTDYYLDVWYVTNYRIIDVEQRGLFSRKMSSFRFNQIQDVTINVSGLLATLIDFGTIEIRTASEETFKFKDVSYPNLLREKIMTEHHRVHEDTGGNALRT
ncbi:MAG: PH domain-containing protein [bacterium]|nr:PH domain-containing protein [bacterium]